MEAALRTAVEELTGEELPSVDFNDVRGTDGIKEASYDVAGMNVKVAVANDFQMQENFLIKLRMVKLIISLLKLWDVRAVA